jgi:ceramide glucosyltransferase
MALTSQSWAEWTLAAWSAVAATWWLLAIALARTRISRAGNQEKPKPQEHPITTLSVFKALPPLSGREVPPALAKAVESFVQQLDDASELLLGVEEADHSRWQPILARWRQDYPRANLVEVCVARPDEYPSPKVSWYRTLAGRARGAIWMWSDADMLAPEGFLRHAIEEYETRGAALLTTPYVVRTVISPPMMLETLFVNAELLPGALLCGRLDAVRFGFGACLIFSAKAFRKKITWEAIGARIADDYLLGKTLQPAQLSGVTLETLAAEKEWPDAAQHYLRWQKTIRWCQPWGFAAQIIIYPVLGWLAYGAVNPASPIGWLGLGAMVAIEAAAALAISRVVGCRMTARQQCAAGLWSLLRALTWLACWFTWPVTFRSQNRRWWSLYHCEPLEGEI